MPTISEPLIEARSWTYTRVRAAFLRSEIGPVTLLVSLQLLGLRPSEAEAEVNLARMEKVQGVAGFIRQITENGNA